MKKIASLVLVLVLLVGCLGALTSCTTFVMGSYTYTDPIFDTKTTYQFIPLNKVTKTTPNLLGDGNVVEEGTYKIAESTDKPGTYVITFTWSNGDVDTKSFTQGTENGVAYVEIGAFKFVKQ